MNKKFTDYGEEYNRESMYETARESLMRGKNVIINGKRQKSLIGVMIQDLKMATDKEFQYFEQSAIALKEKDDEKYFKTLSKTMCQSQIVTDLQKRINGAMTTLKDLKEFNQYVMDNTFTKKKPHEMTISELENLLDILKEYEISLLFRLNNDCITKLTYETYIKTCNYIKEVEQELAKRQAGVKL